MNKEERQAYWKQQQDETGLALTGVIVGWNIDTIDFGMSLYESGMTQQQFAQALMDRGFDEPFAKLFAKEKHWMGDPMLEDQDQG